MKCLALHLSLLVLSLICERQALVCSFSPAQLHVKQRVGRLIVPSATRLYWISQVSRNKNGIDALNELFETVDTPKEGEQGLVFLFVSQFYAEEFKAISQLAASKVEMENTHVIALVGGGVIEGNQEYDDRFSSPAITMLWGILPSTARAIPFMMDPDDSISSWATNLEQSRQDIYDGSTNSIKKTATSKSSHILFVDPWCPHTESMLQLLSNSGVQGTDYDKSGGNEVVIGGISSPVVSERYPTLPSVSINGRTFPKGSAVGFTLVGSVGIQAVVAQGCRPVGPTYTITSATSNVLNELDGKSPLEQLQALAQSMSPEDQRLIQQGGVMCGVEPIEDCSKQNAPEDYLIRQIMGTIPSGKHGAAFIIGVKDLREGDKFQFHLRDANAAKEDMRVMIQRAKTERLFAGPNVAGVPLAALQVSCVARGRGLFGDANVDLEQTNQLLGASGGLVNDAGDAADEEATNPVAGFFAHGEIGPVGISQFGRQDGLSHIHGFTTVVGLLCDFSESNVAQQELTTTVTTDSKENEAWG